MLLRTRPVAAFPLLLLLLRLPRLRLLLLVTTLPLHLLTAASVVVAAAAADNERGLVVPAGAAVLPGGDDIGVSPRYFLGGMAGAQLRARQDGRSCADPDHHVCAELGALGENACCPDDRYCQSYYHGGNGTWEVKCCAFGSVCGSPCSEGQYQGNLTSTITSTVTPGDVVVGTSTLPSESLSTTVVEGGGCVTRACTSTYFKCAASLGGNCCAFGQTCVSGGNCVGTASATPTGGVPPANGCPSSGQFQCPDAARGDCCFTGQACVTSAGTPVCSGAPAGPPGSEITRAESGGLSTGAKAGIGAGIAIGGLAILGLVVWFCLRRRHKGRRHQQQQHQHQHQRRSPYGPMNSGVDNGRGGPASPSAPVPAPHTAEAMSEASGPSRGTGPHRSGLAYDYFGPEAQDGPFTQRHDSVSHAPPDHGVPAQPMGPGDIAAPVELDSRLWRHDRQGAAAASSPRRTPGAASMAATLSVAPSQGQQDALALYELYGSLADPSSLPGTEAPSPRSTSPKPR